MQIISKILSLGHHTTKSALLATSSYKSWRHIHRSSALLAKLTASPSVCLHDVHSRLLLEELRPNTPVTLRAELTNEKGKLFCSTAHYTVDSTGCVDVDTLPSLGGSYEGVFPDGLLTTLAPPPGAYEFSRLYKADPANPWQITVTAHEGHHAPSAEAPPQQIAQALLTRHLMAPGVTRREVVHGRVRGVMYLPPPSAAPAVGLVDMFGAVGGIMEFRAAMLASRGYAVLSLPFYAYKDLPRGMPSELELEYFEEACQYVMEQPNVIPDRVGMISVSKTTDYALLLSTKLHSLTAVVCIGVVGVSYDTDITYRGEVIAKGYKVKIDQMTMDDKMRVFPKKEEIDFFDTESDEFKATIIKLEEASSECRYLLVAGSDDPWGCEMCITHLEGYMKNLGREHQVEGIVYKDAGHLIEPPFGPLIYHSYQRMLPIAKKDAAAATGVDVADIPGGGGDEESVNITGVHVLFGGIAQPVCDAQVDLWQRMQRFLDRNVREKSVWYQNYLVEKQDTSR